jgi:NADH:ubiquinone oxidoreductase subunit 5 (subunit L)/multisubunit Na+/H+ antiporter MnhA subunit
MIYGLSIGQYGIVLIHLVLHAIIKSLLFILAGNSLISFSGNQDIRNLGTRKPILWAILGGLIRRVPFMGIFYRKHGVFNYREGIFCYVSIFLLRVLSFMYIVRLSFIGSRFLNLKTRQSLPSIVLMLQAFVGIVVSSVIVLPIDLIYFSPGLTLVRVFLITLTLNRGLVSYERFAVRLNKGFVSPHFDKVLFIKRF